MEKNRYTHPAILFSMILSISCVYSQNKGIKHTSKALVDSLYSGYLRDSICSITGRKMKIFGKDSIHEFYKNGKVLLTVKYLDSTLPENRKNYNEGGMLKSVEYNLNHPSNLVMLDDFYSGSGILWRRGFYPNSGKMMFQIFFIDTIIINDDNPKECNMLNIFYHENGKIESIGCDGVVDGQNTSVGLQQYFNESGELIGTENYIFPEKTEPYIIITDYYKNGKPKWEKRYINHAIHDGDTEEPSGTWKYYNENGKLVKTENY